MHTVDVTATDAAGGRTDGHRLARYEMPAPEGSKGMPGVIVPRKAVAEIQRLVEDAEADVSIELSSTKARFSFNVVLTTKLIDGTFPDYPRHSLRQRQAACGRARFFPPGGRPRLDHLIGARARREAVAE